MFKDRQTDRRLWEGKCRERERKGKKEKMQGGKKFGCPVSTVKQDIFCPLFLRSSLSFKKFKMNSERFDPATPASRENSVRRTLLLLRL